MLFHRVRAWPALALVVCCLCAAALPAAARDSPAAPPVSGALPAPAVAAVGPDQFGYTAEPVAPEWVDATGGTDLFAPFSGSSENFTKTVTLPFAFPFYENRYDEVTVTASGYLAFAPTGALPAFGGVPDNAVAAYADSYYLSADADGKNGRVFTLSGGTAPNRTFVVEWHGLGGAGGAVVTFQAVLHEDGDILFQYAEMDYGGFPDFCADTRIVDAPGWDGLELKPLCEPVPAHSAWRIARPAEGAHLFAYAPPLGGAAPLGGEAVQEFLVRNTGSIPDRFNLVATSALPVRFLGPDGGELADSNGDGLPDSGPLAVGEVAVLGAAMQFPPLGNPGLRGEAAVEVLSARNAAAAQRTLSLSAVVPYAFAQPFCVQLDSATCAGVRVLDVRPAGVSQPLAALDDPAGTSYAVATRPNAGYAAVWTGSEGATKHVRSALLGLDGARTGEVQTPVESSDPAFSFEQPVAAVAPDGSTGVAWVRIEFHLGGFEEPSYYRADVFFAVLGPDGGIAVPPVNVTNNELATSRFEYLRNLDIAAVGGGRFALGWNTVLPSEGWGIGDSYDVYLALLSGSGALLRDVITVSDSAENYWGDAGDPSVAALAGDRVVVAYRAPSLSAPGVGFTVFSGAGDRLLPFTALSAGAGAQGVDAVEIGGGSLLLAWDSWDDAGSHQVEYSLLDAGDYSVRKAATPLSMPAVAAAVARDGAGNGIISAQGAYTGRLTAAAVNPAGDVVMPPTSFAGNAVADLLAGRARLLATPGAIAHPLSPTSADKADLVLAAVASGGVPGRIPAAPAVAIVNRGALTAQGGTLTAVLDPALTYAGAFPEPDGMAAAAGGTTVTWTLPDLDYLGGGTVTLLAKVPDAPLGSSYPVTFTLTTPTPVLDPAHGQAVAQVTVAAPTYLPFVGR